MLLTLMQKICRILENKLCYLIVILLLLTGCTFASGNNQNIITSNGGYVVSNGDYLYYYEFEGTSYKIFRYNSVTDKNEYIEDLGGKSGIGEPSKLFCLDDNIYYAKCDYDAGTTQICRIDNNSTVPITVGEIDTVLSIGRPDIIQDYEFRMYKKGDLYVLMKRTLYQINNGKGEVIAENLNSLYIDDENAYYSIYEENPEDYLAEADCSIFQYNFKTKKIKEIVSADNIKKYNADNTIMGPQSYVMNIIKDENYLYFLSAEPSSILRCNIKENSDVEGITKTEYRDYPYTYAFNIYENEIYYIECGGNLYLSRTNKTGTEHENLIQNVYTYTILGDNIYYYSGMDDIPKLRVYNTKDLSDKAFPWRRMPK